MLRVEFMARLNFFLEQWIVNSEIIFNTLKLFFVLGITEIILLCKLLFNNIFEIIFMVRSNLDIMRHMFDALDVFIGPKIIRKPLLGVLGIF